MIFLAAIFLAVSQGEAAPVPQADTPATPAQTQPLPEIGGTDQLAVFVLQRGFYFSSDLGVSLTLGGQAGVSNVQPYLSMTGGFDVNNYLSVQAYVSHVYSSGNPVSAEDIAVGGSGIINYSMFNFGGQLVGALRPTPRLAIEPKVGGGLTSTYPTDPKSLLKPTAPHISFGLDFKYLTLLTDFTAGISTTGYYVLGPNVLAVGLGGVVRYTF